MISNRSRFLIQSIWIGLMLFSYLTFSYYYFPGWWCSSIGTMLILVFSYFNWGKTFLSKTGLNINIKTILKSIILAGILVVCSMLIMKYIASMQQVEIHQSNWKNYFHDVFYTLNEEIILGAIVLFTLVDIKKVKPIVASFGLAIVFSIIHFVFYKWIFLERGILQISTLVSLFFVGIVRNNLILQTRHIGYSWALHFAWMAVMFGSTHFYSDTNIHLKQTERFNAYLGSTEMMVLSGILVLVSLVFWWKGRQKGNITLVST